MGVRIGGPKRSHARGVDQPSPRRVLLLVVVLLATPEDTAPEPALLLGLVGVCLAVATGFGAGRVGACVIARL